MSEVNKVKRKDVCITLGDAEYPLKYTLNSFSMMEEKYGSVDDALAAMEKGSIAAIRYMIYVGIIAANPEMTELEVGGLIDIQDLEAITDKMAIIMQGDLPEQGQSTLPNK